MAMEADKTNISIWTLFMSSSFASSIAHGPELHRELGSTQEFWIWEYCKPVQCYKKDGWWKCRDSECDFFRRFKPFVGKINIAQWSNNGVVKSTSIHLLGFRDVPGRTERSWWCKQKMGRTSVHFEDVQYFQRTARIGLRTNWLRVENLPKILCIAASPHNSQRSGKKTHHTQISDRIIFMSMFNYIELEKTGNEESWALTSRAIRDYSSRFKDGHWALLGAGEDNKWYHDFAASCEGEWVGSLCFSNGGRFREFGTYPVFLKDKSVGPRDSEEEERQGHHPF